MSVLIDRNGTRHVINAVARSCGVKDLRREDASAVGLLMFGAHFFELVDLRQLDSWYPIDY